MSDMVLDAYGVTEKNSIPVVSSRRVAEIFSKRHDNVLRDISDINSGLLKIEEPNWQTNFIKSTYSDRGKKYPEYLLTRDGFTLLAMGFTGKKAMQFKVAYINRFNQMEQLIQELQEAKMEFPEFTDAVLALHEEPKPYHFSNEINMINRIVLGMSASEFKQAHGLDKKVKSIRPYLALNQIQAIKALQRVDIGLLVAIPDFQERKRMLTEHYNRRRLTAIA